MACRLPCPRGARKPEEPPVGELELRTRLRGALVKRRLLDRWELCCPSAQ